MQPAAYHENDAAPIGAPRGMVSYSHADETETVTCLAQELRLRGATMLRDLEHFRAARATSASMADAISGDLVVAHLTENALQSVPVVERELKPALDRYANTGKPLVVLVPHGLGDDWDAIDARIDGRLPTAVSARWGRVYSDPAPLDQSTCATIAGGVIASLFGVGRGPTDGCWELTVVTRGNPMPSAGLLIDATGIVGGPSPRCGSADDWERIFSGITDLAAVLHAHSSKRRRLDLTPQCHLTAALATGFAFRRACGWTICAADRAGNACDQGPGRDFDRFIVPPLEPGRSEDERLFVELAIGRSISRGVESVIERTGVPRARLRINYAGAADLTAEEMAPAAAAVADLIKAQRHDLGVKRVELFMAAPAAFAVLLGAELNALGALLGLHEHDNDDYVPTLTIDAR